MTLFFKPRNDPIEVNLGMAPIKVLKLSRHFLTMGAFMKFTWKDIFLNWNPDEYNGANMVVLPASGIWKPDITIWNE